MEVNSWFSTAAAVTADQTFITALLLITVYQSEGAVLVRAPSPQSAMVGKEPIVVECLYRSTGKEIVLGVNIHRQRSYEASATLIAQIPNKDFVSLPPTLVDKYLINKANISVQTKGEFMSAQVFIFPVECEDEGTYECEVQVYGGISPRRPKIQVHLNEEPSSPSLEQSPYILVENYPVTFTCTGGMGRPESSFKWFVYKSTHRDVVEEVEMSGITSLDRSTGSCSPRGHSTLAIMITRADQKVKCVVRQQTGKEAVEVSDERILDVQFSVTDTEVGVKVNEKFKETAEEILVREGDNVRLTCQAWGNPEPVFSWSCLPLQGHTQGNGLNVLVEQPDLLLTNVTSNHSASYVCVATNFIRGKKQTETKAVRIIVKEKMFSSTKRLKNESGFHNPALRYGMIVGTVLGSMVLVLLISLLSVIIYRRCTRMEDRKYLVQYKGVKA